MSAPASRLTTAAAAVAALMLLHGGGAAAQSGRVDTPADQERWDTVKGIYFPDRAIEDGSGPGSAFGRARGSDGARPRRPRCSEFS